MAWNAMDALNRNTQAAVTDERPKARFRIRDINIKKMYSNDANFYSMQDVEQLAQKIYAVGLLENLTVVHDPCDRGEYRIEEYENLFNKFREKVNEIRKVWQSQKGTK